MTRSDSYKFDTSFVTDVSTQTDMLKLQSKTFYTGAKGDEIADYSENYSVKVFWNCSGFVNIKTSCN